MTKHSRITSTSLRLAALVLAIAGSGSAIAASAIANSTSTVIAAINIAKDTDLAFGSFAAGASAGTVTVTPGGARSSGGGVTVVASTASAAKFDVTGQAGLGYSISVSATPLSSGGNTMTFTPISDLTASSNTTGTVAVGTLTGGAQSIFVGGVLDVGANQVAGAYSGTVTASVDYN